MNDLHITEKNNFGTDRGRGNLLGIEPYITPLDYASQNSFYDKLDRYLSVARELGWVNEKTIVVWPEYIGTWLVLAEESASLYRAETMAAAETQLVLRHLFPFIWYWLTAKERNRQEAAFFRIKAKRMAEIYNAVFSDLARAYSITIAAGSIVLPEPFIEGGRVQTGRGALYNAGAVFGPDGAAYPAILRKAFPTSEELPFTAPAPVDDLPFFETKAGRLGVLICADSWFPAAYARLKSLNIGFMLVPSFEIGTLNSWNQPWQGYNGWPAPADVDPQDVGKLTEGEAWLKYAMAGRIAEAGAQHGVNVFLRGALWDQKFDGGRTTIVSGGRIMKETASRGASLNNLWL